MHAWMTYVSKYATHAYERREDADGEPVKRSNLIQINCLVPHCTTRYLALPLSS